jgi:rhomboid protease GluP
VPVPLRWRYKLDRWRDSLAGIFRSEPQERRPRMCPACGTLVGSAARKCHECGANLTFSLAAASRSLSGLLPTESPITYIILGLNFLLFVVSLLATMRISQESGGQGLNLFGGINGLVLDRLGASRPLVLINGEWWRLVMAIFLHGGILHIAMNTWVLMDIGPQVEEVYGSARYLFLYIATGIAGFLASAITGHFSVGASGALMGLIGLMLAITTRRGGAYMQMIRGQLIRWVVYILVLGFVVSGIDNAAHLGGLAAGFLLGRVMADREPMNATERKRAYALGWAAGLVVVASFAAMLAHYFRPA